MSYTDLQALLTDPAMLPRSTTLLHESGLRALLLHLKTGEHIPEHQAKGAITVHCLKGAAIFSSADERMELRPGSLIGLAPGAPHSVAAQKDTLLLVTISEQIAPPTAA